ncbi:hypothetical protein [Canibacter zhoujuaniae]|uniref:hypothetical protein n=1 Tax=Canibacter zhoujuaniae TaxID=2708343 RepID=UPI001FBB7D15|nr:hypothetical protein [Canibacter zhoujuaniae]
MKKYKALIAASAAALLLAGCAGNNSASMEEADHDHHDHEHGIEVEEGLTEVSKLERRAVLAVEGGLVTVNLATGEVVNEVKQDGFLRLNQAGDNRHLLVSKGNEFQLFDTGLVAEAHGDHFHYFEGDPKLTDVRFPAEKAGHVTVHDGYTTLFADGDGTFQVVPTEHIKHGTEDAELHKTGDAHHGVAVRLSDGSIFHTEGHPDARSVLRVVNGEKTVAVTEDCPGSHGEATAKPNANGDVVVMGCQNGPFVFKDGQFHKVPVADAYSRSGNLAGHPDSPIVLGDYKVDPNADPVERPTRVALIDTEAVSLKLVELNSAYWFRSLGRGPAGEGLVLTYDGNLNVIDQNTGEVTNRVPVIGEWEEKADWQEPGPILKVNGSWAYITDAVKKELAVVDLTSFEVTKRISLDKPVVEMEIVAGK